MIFRAYIGVNAFTDRWPGELTSAGAKMHFYPVNRGVRSSIRSSTLTNVINAQKYRAVNDVFSDIVNGQAGIGPAAIPTLTVQNICSQNKKNDKSQHWDSNSGIQIQSLMW